MKILIFTLCFLGAGICSLHAQLYFNAGIGAMNYAGDLQEKNITLSEASYGLSIGSSYQFSGHIIGNLDLTFGKVGASDSKNADKWHYRNLSFQSNIFEAAITAEGDLFDISSSGDGSVKFTPYGFIGLGIFNFNPYTNYNGQKVFLAPLKTEGESEPYELWSVSIPFGIGIKYAVSDNVMIAAEMNYRKTNTDHLDDVSAVHFTDTAQLLATNGQMSATLSYRADEIAGTKYPFYGQRGNPAKKDNYYTFMIKVIFTLGGNRAGFEYGYGN